MHDNVDVINEFSCYEVKIAKSRQSDNHQPSRSSMCTADRMLQSHTQKPFRTLFKSKKKQHFSTRRDAVTFLQ